MLDLEKLHREAVQKRYQLMTLPASKVLALVNEIIRLRRMSQKVIGQAEDVMDFGRQIAIALHLPRDTDVVAEIHKWRSFYDHAIRVATLARKADERVWIACRYDEQAKMHRDEPTLYADSSDVFAWGDTGADEVTPDLADVWEKAIDDIRAAVRQAPEEERKNWQFARGAWVLAMCRIAKKRPLGAYYKLFRAGCGRCSTPADRRRECGVKIRRKTQ